MKPRTILSAPTIPLFWHATGISRGSRGWPCNFEPGWRRCWLANLVLLVLTRWAYRNARCCGRWRMCSRESPSAEWNRAHPGGNSRAHRAVGAFCRAGARSVHSSVANRSSCVPDLRLAEEPRTPGEFSVPRTGSDPGPGRRLPRDDAARWYLRWGAFRSAGVRPIVW